MSRPAPRRTLFPYTTLFRSPVREDRFADGAGPHGRGFFQKAGEAVTVASAVRGRRVGQAVADQDQHVAGLPRSEEHTSELQSHSDLVCRLLLEKKKTSNATR